MSGAANATLLVTMQGQSAGAVAAANQAANAIINVGNVTNNVNQKITQSAGPAARATAQQAAATKALGAAAATGAPAMNNLNLAMRGAAATISILDPRMGILISHFAYFENALPNHIVPGFIAVAAAIGLTTGAVAALMAGGRVEASSKSFEALAGSLQEAERRMRMFKEASAGTLSSQEIRGSTSVGLALGIDPGKLAELMKMVRIESRAFNLDFKEQWEQAVHGVTRKEIELLDQLGVSFKGMEVSAMSTGEIMDEVLRQMSKTVEKLGGDVRSADEDYRALGTTLKDLWDRQLLDWSQAPHTQWLRSLPGWIKTAIDYYGSLGKAQAEAANAGGFGVAGLSAKAKASGKPETYVVPGTGTASIAFPSGNTYNYPGSLQMSGINKLAEQTYRDRYFNSGVFNPFDRSYQVDKSSPQYQKVLEETFLLQTGQKRPLVGPPAPKKDAAVGPAAPTTLDAKLKGADYVTVGGKVYSRSGKEEGISLSVARSKGRVVVDITPDDLAFLRAENPDTGGGGGGRKPSQRDQSAWNRLTQPIDTRMNIFHQPDSFRLDYLYGDDFYQGADGSIQSRAMRKQRGAGFDRLTAGDDPLADYMAENRLAFRVPEYGGIAGIRKSFLESGIGKRFQKAGKDATERLAIRKDRLQSQQDMIGQGVMQFGAAAMSGDRPGMAGAIGSTLGGIWGGMTGGALATALGSAMPFVGPLMGMAVSSALSSLFERRQLTKSELLSVRIESMSPQAAMQMGSTTFAMISGMMGSATNTGAMQLAGQAV